MTTTPRDARTVVITGMGTVGPFGIGVDAFDASLADDGPRLTEVDRSGGYHLADSARLAGLIDPAQLKAHFAAGAARRMSLPSRMVVVAAKTAAAAAGLDGTDSAPFEGAGVCVGTAFGPSAFMGRILDQIRETGPQTVSPFLFMESVANVMAGQVALALGATGPNATITQREASALLAVARGKALIETGVCERVLAGCVDEVSPIIHAALDRFGALARSSAASGEPSERARVFDARRNGYVACEGATILVLEAERSARARGALPLARVGTAIRANDPTASASNWGRGGERLAQTVTRGLAAAGVATESIDRVVSGASGSRRGDALEAEILRGVWSTSEVPPVFAPKAYTGEMGGGFLAAAVRSLAIEIPGPTPGFEDVDDELALAPFFADRLAPAKRALVSSLAPGGAAAWLLLESVR